MASAPYHTTELTGRKINAEDNYHRWRTHLGLEMDTPQSREAQAPDNGKVTEVPDLGGLHHHYLRLAA